jgi:hypothetical protein
MEIELLALSYSHVVAATRARTEQALADVGLEDAATVRTTVVGSLDAAHGTLTFLASPTILIDGHDPFAVLGLPPVVASRLYRTVDGLQAVPDLRDLRRALLEADARASEQP